MFVLVIDRPAALLIAAACALFFVGLLLLGWMLYSSVNRKFSRICELVEADCLLEEQQQAKPSEKRLFLVDSDEVY